MRTLIALLLTAEPLFAQQTAAVDLQRGCKRPKELEIEARVSGVKAERKHWIDRAEGGAGCGRSAIR